MPIRIQIREVAQKRGLKNAYQLRVAAKIAPATASRCYANKMALITLETLEKLCVALECKPGDLFTVTKS